MSRKQARRLPDAQPASSMVSTIIATIALFCIIGVLAYFGFLKPGIAGSPDLQIYPRPRAVAPAPPPQAAIAPPAQAAPTPVQTPAPEPTPTPQPAAPAERPEPEPAATPSPAATERQ